MYFNLEILLLFVTNRDTSGADASGNLLSTHISHWNESISLSIYLFIYLWKCSHLQILQSSQTCHITNGNNHQLVKPRHSNNVRVDAPPATVKNKHSDPPFRDHQLWPLLQTVTLAHYERWDGAWCGRRCSFPRLRRPQQLEKSQLKESSLF